uniref:OTU domain-containing protein n=1 Tax=Panagrellus redivivus TaxID=6233 RepID=A0A7E4VJQ4_PANRE
MTEPICYTTEGVIDLLDRCINKVDKEYRHSTNWRQILTKKINERHPNRRPAAPTTVGNWMKKRKTEIEAQQSAPSNFETDQTQEAQLPPPPEPRQRHADIYQEISGFKFGYNDHGSESLLYYYSDDASVHVYHANSISPTETRYYTCANASCESRGILYCGTTFKTTVHTTGCGQERRHFDLEQCLRLAKFRIRTGSDKQSAHRVAQALAIELGCYEGIFPPYSAMSKAYIRVEKLRRTPAVETLYTGEKWQLHDADGIQIYATERMLTALATCEIAMVDGTFTKSPQGFHQVLTISGLLQSAGSSDYEYQPLVMALLPNKTVEAYQTVVNVIKEEWKKLQLTSCIQRLHCDYETALQDAMKDLVGKDNVYGCLFHYSQALLKYCIAKGLYQHYKATEPDYEGIREWIRNLLGLPCLPKEDRQRLWRELLSHPPQRPPNSTVEWPTKALNAVVAYMEKWMALSDNTWTFWLLGRTRNTNAMEAFHRMMPCNERKPRLGKFLELNRVFYTDVNNQILRLQNGCSTKRRSKRYVTMQKAVATMEHDFIDQMPEDPALRLGHAFQFCSDIARLLQDIRNKSCETVKSGNRASAKNRVVTHGAEFKDEIEAAIVSQEESTKSAYESDSQDSSEDEDYGLESECESDVEIEDSSDASSSSSTSTSRQASPVPQQRIHHPSPPCLLPPSIPMTPPYRNLRSSKKLPLMASNSPIKVVRFSKAKQLIVQQPEPSSNPGFLSVFRPVRLVPRKITLKKNEPTPHEWVYSSPTSEDLKQRCRTHLGDDAFELNRHLPVSHKVLQKVRQFSAIDVPGDGHCGYSALSVLLTGNIGSSLLLRRLICSNIAEGKMPNAFYEIFGDGLTPEKRRQSVIDKALLKLNPGKDALKQCYWWSEVDTVAASIIFDINIAVYVDQTPRSLWTLWNESSLPKPMDTVMKPKPTVILYLKNSHYNAIVCVD